MNFDPWVSPTLFYSQVEQAERYGRANWKKSQGGKYGEQTGAVPQLSFMSEMPDEYLKETDELEKRLTKARYGGGMEEATYIPREEQWWRPPVANLDRIKYPPTLGSTVVSGTVWTPRTDDVPLTPLPQLSRRSQRTERGLPTGRTLTNRSQLSTRRTLDTRRSGRTTGRSCTSQGLRQAHDALEGLQNYMDSARSRSSARSITGRAKEWNRIDPRKDPQDGQWIQSRDRKFKRTTVGAVKESMNKV